MTIEVAITNPEALIKASMSEFGLRGEERGGKSGMVMRMAINENVELLSQ